MATQLNKVERKVFNQLKVSKAFKMVDKWWLDTACLSGKTKAQQRKENMENLRKCARIIVRNPKINPSRIFGWWFCIDGYRKPKNIELV